MPENTPPNKPKTPHTAWKPGQSGNPGGRPKVAVTVQQAAREHTVAAIKTLAEICTKGTSETARVAAAERLLDRAWGKPLQSHELNHNLSATTAGDAALLAIAVASGSVAASQAGDTTEPEGVVH